MRATRCCRRAGQTTRCPPGCSIPRLSYPACLAKHFEAKIRRTMLKRLEASPDLPLSQEALAELRQRYAMLSKPSLQQVYADALERCKLDRSGRPPRAEQFQIAVAYS
jgi:hypothetical protein